MAQYFVLPLFLTSCVFALAVSCKEDVKQTISHTKTEAKTDTQPVATPVASIEPVVQEVKQSPVSKATAKSDKPPVSLETKPIEPTSQTQVVNEPKPTTNTEIRERPQEVPIEYPGHSTWNDLLTAHVSNTGNVDYKALKSEQARIEAYLEELSAMPPTKTWSKTESMAFWINAYNAATVVLILKNYPLKSIQDLDGGKTWDVKRIKLGDKTYSLNQIENEILRAKYKDARIHFAVNCAAKGCPPLLNQAFKSNTLEEQLNSQTRKFVRNKKYNQIEGKSAQVSKIFDWYASDFGDLKQFLNTYLTSPIATDAQISFKDYDWSLNGN
jgi:hypothetical protein